MVANTNVSDGAANDPRHWRDRHWVAPASIALLAFCVRALPLRNVFIDGQIYFTDSDSYYHLRRIAYNLASFPGTLGHDPYLNFPRGAKAIWPETLDWLLAAVVWPFHSAGSEPGYERFLAWVPPLFGALTVFVAFRIAANYFGHREAIVASLVLAILPAHFWYSQVGFLDHHVVVALCATLLLGSTMNIVRSCANPSLSRAALFRGATFLGLLQAASLSIWPGALLYVALSQGSVAALAMFANSHETRNRAFACLGAASVVAFVCIAPLCIGSQWPQWGPYSAVVLSNFQPWWFATAAMFALVSRQLVGRTPDARTAHRAGAVAFIGLSLVAVSASMLPDLEASFRDSTQWLGRTDSFQAMVGESMPLFVLHGKFTTEIANSRLSYFIYLFPVVILALAFQWRVAANGAPLLVFVFWALVLFGFTLLQKRFFNTYSVALAMIFGVAFVRSCELINERFRTSQRSALLMVTLASLLIVSPCLAVYRAELTGVAQGFEGGASVRNPRIEANILRREMTTWLRQNTPPTRSFVAKDGVPEYGVMARWGEGHFITYGARRPAVMGNFGDDLGKEHFLFARSFFDASPERAEAILEELGVRYVVVRARFESRPIAKLLYQSDGSRMGRYRLLHEIRPPAGRELASYKIFEFVAGAELVGRAPARELVKAQLEFTTNLGREARFEMVALADADGRYRLRLPYATQGAPGELRTAARYRVTVDDVVQEVAVTESDVTQGATLDGPDF